MSRTLICVDRLQETRHDVILTKNQPRIVHVNIGHVDLDSDESGKGKGVFGFCASEVSCSGDVLASPMHGALREK